MIYKKCGSPDHFITQCKAKLNHILKFDRKLDINKRKCQKCFKDANDKPDYYKYCSMLFYVIIIFLKFFYYISKM